MVAAETAAAATDDVLLESRSISQTDRMTTLCRHPRDVSLQILVTRLTAADCKLILPAAESLRLFLKHPLIA